MEVIDYLLLFWAALTIGVYSIGSIYEQQLEAKRRVEEKKRKQEARKREQQTLNANYNASATSQYSQYNNNSSGQQYGVSTTNSFNLQDSSSYYNNNNSSTYNNNQTPNSWTNQAHDTPYRDYGMSAAPSYQQSQQQTRSSYEESMAATGGTGSMNLGGDVLAATGAIPTATGFNQDCVDWVNQILYLFYTQPQKYGPQIIESVYRSLNEKLSNLTNSNPDYSSLIIEFTGINRELSSMPELTNIRTETESEKSVSVICKVYLRKLVLDLTIQAQSEHQINTFRYELVLENLEGKLKTMAMLNDKLIVIQFLEKPDTKILLKPKYNSSSSGESCPINEDILVSLILQSLTQVVVDLYFGDDPDFPQYIKHSGTFSSMYRNKLDALKGSASEIKRHIRQDFFGALTHSAEHKERKVFIKILRAKNINYNQNVTCLMELDQPHQQATTTTQQGSNPFWDEHFLFNVTDKSVELMLELWDSINVAAISSSGTGTGETNQQQQHQHKRTKSMSLTQPSQSSSLLSNQVKQSQSSKQSKWNKADLTRNGKFLGFARVSIEDLRRNPVQKVSLPLQSFNRPSNNNQQQQQGGQLIMGSPDLADTVGGELQLELLFLEHSPNTSSTLTSGTGSTTGSLCKSGSTNSLAHLHNQPGEVVSVDRKLTPSGYVITTTTILKPLGSQQHLNNRQQQQDQQNKLLSTGRESLRNASPISQLSTEHSGAFASELGNLDGISSRLTDVPTPTTDLDNQNSRQERGRSRSRSRSLLRAIKKRFSFSRTRSRSVGGSATGEGLNEAGGRQNQQQTSNLDALSIDSRSRASSEVSTSGRAKSVPTTREASEVPVIVINKGRLSDAASAFTFFHPKSQLVIECVEPRLNDDGTISSSAKKGRLRYYAIPDDAANKRKWRKRGTKLHLFNEHQFVATHLAGSSTCHLCGRVFSRRPGKQGYKCRNCHLLSHKECHVKVDHNCPYALKDGLKLEYIDADPPASLLLEQGRIDSDNERVNDIIDQTNQFNFSASTYSQPIRSHRLSSKSISMEMEDR